MSEGRARASWGFVSFVCKLGCGVTIGQKDHLPSFPVTPCQAEQALGSWPTEGDSRQLTEDEEVLQVLEEGALELLLLLPGQLLGDSAAVAQAGPQPVAWGRQEVTLRRQTEAHRRAGTLQGCAPAFPKLWKPAPSPKFGKEP